MHELVPTAVQIGNSSPSYEKWKARESPEKIELHPNELPSSLIQPEFIELEGKKWTIWNLFSDSNVSCYASELIHKVPTFGFVFQEPNREGLFDKEKLKQFGLANSPLCKKLKNGESVLNPMGQTVTPDDVKRPTQIGRKISVLGDTCDSRLSIGPCLDSDIVMHESTLENDLEELAIDHGHSTPR